MVLGFKEIEIQTFFPKQRHLIVSVTKNTQFIVYTSYFCCL